MEYKSKHYTVTAEQFIKGGHVPTGVRYNPRSSPEARFLTQHGDMVIESGEWVVTESNGFRFVLADDAFQRRFEKA